MDSRQTRQICEKRVDLVFETCPRLALRRGLKTGHSLNHGTLGANSTSQWKFFQYLVWDITWLSGRPGFVVQDMESYSLAIWIGET